MISLWRYLTWFFAFALYAVLLLMIGETFLEFILMSLGVLLLVSGFQVFGVRFTHRTRSLIWLWSFFLGIALISFFTSSNIPLSLSAIARMIFGFIVFSSFATYSKKMSSEQVLLCLVVVGFVLGVISLLITVYPSVGLLIPGMNMFYATFGHNHIASFLIMVIPINWRLLYFSDISRKNPMVHRVLVMLVVFSTLLLVSSFARVAILIGFAQLIAIYWFSRQEKKIPKHILFIQRTMLGLFLLVVMIKVLFSLPSGLQESWLCDKPLFSRVLCKSVEFELRPLYWQQAWQIFVNNALIGSGPGTFTIASRLYHQRPDANSSYVHNAFLEALSDMGLLGGGMYIVLMVTLLYQAVGAYFRLKMSFDGWELAVLIAIVSSYINSLFDFDWHFNSVFMVTLILIALLIREGGKTVSMEAASRLAHTFLKTTYAVACAILVFVGATYGVAELLIAQGNVNRVFELFPYFNWHRKLFEHAQLSEDNRQRFQKLYEMYPDVYFSRLQSVTNEEEAFAIRSRLAMLDPWQRIHQSTVPYYISKQKWHEADIELNKINDLIQRGEQYKHYVPYSKKADIAEQMVTTAQKLFEENRLKDSARLYVLAHRLDPWQPGRRWPLPKLAVSSKDLSQQLDFLNAISEIDGGYLQDRDAFGELYWKVVLEKLKTREPFDYQKHLSSIKKIGDLDNNFLWEKGYHYLMASGDENMAYIVWETLSTQGDGSQLSTSYKQQLAVELVRKANKKILEDGVLTAEYYLKASKLDSGTIYRQPLWFNQISPSKVSTTELQKYLTTVHEKKETLGDIYDERNVVVIEELIARFIENDEVDEVNNLIKVVDWNQLSLEHRRRIINRLVLLVERLVANEKKGQALELTDSMVTITPETYLVLSLPGHTALLNGDMQVAKEKFMLCNQLYAVRYGEAHNDCEAKKQSLDKGESPNSSLTEIIQHIKNTIGQ